MLRLRSRSPAARRLAVACGLASLVAAAAAETSAVSPAGFTVGFEREVKATPHELFRAIGRIGRWWNGEHTWSGDAAHLSLDLRAGGCFCERWPAGSVQHATVVWVGRDRMVRMVGSLGPLQELGVNGVLTFALKPAEGRTTLKVSYRVAGGTALEQLAPAVDRVIGEQVDRLVAYAEKEAR